MLPSLAIRSAACSLKSLASFSDLKRRDPVLLSAFVTLPVTPTRRGRALPAQPPPTELLSPTTKRTSQTPGDTSSGSSAVTVWALLTVTDAP